jgi:YD repeat-containing protein
VARTPLASGPASTPWRARWCSFCFCLFFLVAGDSFAQTHVYDSIGRLRWTTQAGGASISYAYDQNGNLLSVANITPGQDSDGDGLPDSFEILWTGGASTTALDPGADPERDGLINFLEFALARRPDSPDAAALTPVSIELSGPERYVTFRYLRPKQGPALLDYKAEVSFDLASGQWSSDPADVEQVAVLDQGGGVELVTIRARTAISAASQIFLRLRITKLP